MSQVADKDRSSVPMMEKGDGKSPDESVNLKPKIGLVSGCGIIVGSIIGSGIFVSPRGVLMHTGSPGLSLIIWLLCGLYSMVGAYCYAELGTTITRSGADYAYMYEAFGPFVAFIRLWVECIIVRPCTTAIVALTFSYYVIEPLFPDCEQPDLAVKILAGICIGELWSAEVAGLFTKFVRLADFGYRLTPLLLS